MLNDLVVLSAQNKKSVRLDALFRMVTRTSPVPAYGPTDRIQKPEESPTA